MTSILALLLLLTPAPSVCTPPRIEVVLGVTDSGAATPLWLAVLRRRLSPEAYTEVAPLIKPLTKDEQAWAVVIRARVRAWEGEIPALTPLFAPESPPAVARVVLGNRGASDAFTHDPTTIGFDLASLQAAYGDASGATVPGLLDRLFRHEYVHLLQKAWLATHPYPAETPLKRAVLDIWAEGLGNYFSLSDRWRIRDGSTPEAMTTILATLEPRFVARLAALACASSTQADSLMADLSSGPFTRKWGALPAALWLEQDIQSTPEALRSLVVAGPDGVWDLAARRLPGPLTGAMAEIRQAAALCATGAR